MTPPSLIPHAQAGHVPASIVAAGTAACAAWEAFLADDRLRPSTRRIYRGKVEQFLRWLESQGIGLVDITVPDVERFLISWEGTPASKSMYRTPLRRFFDALVARKVMIANPLAWATTSKGGPMQEREERKNAKAPPTRAELVAAVHELALDPLDEGEEDFEAAMVMMAALYLGTRKILPLSHLTGVPSRRVAQLAANLRANGVWTAEGKTAAAWDDVEDGVMAFWMDVWVAIGDFVRGPADNPAPRERVPDA